MTLTIFFKDSSTPHSTIRDRGHISYEPTWKGGGHKSKNYQSALSALTLVAFLFFLNMLQSCLQDSLQSQAPITIMTTSVTTTTQEGTKRQKRDNDKIENDINLKLISEHQYTDSIHLQNDKDKETTKDSERTKSPGDKQQNENNDYTIFLMDNDITPNETIINEKSENKLKTIGKSQFSNWLYDNCCKCESLHKKDFADNPKGILRSGIYSLMCEFIEAINIQRYCKHDDNCEFQN